VLEYCNSLSMGLQILLRWIDFRYFLMVNARRAVLVFFCPSCYVIDNGDSYSRLRSDVDQAIRLFFPAIWVFILLATLIAYFNVCPHARSFGIEAQIKIMGEPLLVL
jgi:hypothetical protein